MSDTRQAQESAVYNPYEMTLAIGSVIAIILGVIVNFAASSSIESSYSGTTDAVALAWAGLGAQLWQLGVVVFIGVLFYYMVRWDRANS